MRGGVFYERTSEKDAMLYGSAGPCVSHKMRTTQNPPETVHPRPKKVGAFCIFAAHSVIPPVMQLFYLQLSEFQV
jgi:hypothetical protein